MIQFFFPVKIIGNSQLENWKILGGDLHILRGNQTEFEENPGEQGPDNEITEITMIYRVFATCQ